MTIAGVSIMADAGLHPTVDRAGDLPILWAVLHRRALLLCHAATERGAGSQELRP